MKFTKYAIAIGLVFAGAAHIAMGRHTEKQDVTLPSSKILAKRLEDAGFEHFIEKTKLHEQLGGQTKAPLGIAVAVELALADYAESLQNPIVAAAMNLRKDQLIETILEGFPEAIQELKDQNILESGEESKIERKKKHEPIPAKKSEALLYDYKTFTDVKQIGNILWEIIEKYAEEDKKAGGRPWIRDGREGWPTPNPFYDQTDQGFFLEFYYGHPSSLWTPWGTVELVGSSSTGIWEKVIEEFFKRVKTELVAPEKSGEFGVYGPIYKIISIEGRALPEAILTKHKAYSDYDNVNKAWESLEDRYKSEKNKEL